MGDQLALTWSEMRFFKNMVKRSSPVKAKNGYGNSKISGVQGQTSKQYTEEGTSKITQYTLKSDKNTVYSSSNLTNSKNNKSSSKNKTDQKEYNLNNYETFAGTNDVQKIYIGVNSPRDLNKKVDRQDDLSKLTNYKNSSNLNTPKNNSNYNREGLGSSIKKQLGQRSQSEVIVTNSPIADGTVFISKTGGTEQKMVVLREEYYQKLVKHLQQKEATQDIFEMARRQRPMTVHKLSGKINTDISSSIKTSSQRNLNYVAEQSRGNKPQEYLKRSLQVPTTTPRISNVQTNAEKSDRYLAQRSNSERILRLPNSFLETKRTSSPLHYTQNNEYTIRKTRTQFLRDISLQRKIEKLDNLPKSSERVLSSHRKVHVPIFDDERRMRASQ